MDHETNKKQYLVTGMTCAACQGHVERAVKKVPGVSKVSVALLTNSMIVEGTAGEDDVVRAVEKAGYGASPMGDTRVEGSPLISAEEEALKDRETPRLMKRLIWSVLFLVLLMYITMGHNMLSWPVPAFLDHNHLGLALSQMLLALFVLVINRDFFISGIRSFLAGRAEYGCAGRDGIGDLLPLVTLHLLSDDMAHHKWCVEHEYHAALP